MTDVAEVLLKLPPMCATHVPGVKGPVLIKRGVQGYWPLRPDLDVDAFNVRNGGATPRQIECMVLGSMFGWDAPGADPDYAG